jgi:hypothetical protein
MGSGLPSSTFLQDPLLRWFIKFLTSRKIILKIVPARRSSFSLPLSFVTSIISPVPRAPCLPLRKTSARAVVGLSPFSSRLVWFLTLVDTCLGPTGTRSREVEGVDLVGLAIGFGGMVVGGRVV